MEFCAFIRFFQSLSLSSIITLLLSAIGRLLIKLSPPRKQCSCEICQGYLTRTWSKKFPNLCDWYSHLLQNSPTATIHIHVADNIITANPQNVEHILRTRFHNYPKGKPFSAILGDLLGKGIFNADGDSWNFQRKISSLQLGSVSVRSYAFTVISSEIKTRLVPLMESKLNETVDLQDVFRRFAFDTICRFSFGLDPGCLHRTLPESEFASAFDKASKLSAERAMIATPLVWKLKRFFNLGSERELRSAINSINILAEEVIKQKREMGSGQTESQSDLLSRFMETITDDDYLRDIVVSFLLAGRDTVASALTSFFWLLAKNPEITSKIREESNRVMGEPDTVVPKFEQLQKMNYLQAAVYESLRIFPPVQFDSKFALQPDILPDGSFVNRGTRVTYHPYAMGRMEQIWGSDCLEFKPERWLNEEGIFTPANPYNYPVFQAGVRVCLGKEMALVEMKCVAVSFIRRFDTQLVDPTDSMLRFVPGLTATVSGGVPVVIRRRRRLSRSDHR